MKFKKFFRVKLWEDIMRKFFFLYLWFFLLPVIGLSYTGEVIESFDLPSSCPTGLTYDGKNIWVADRKTDTLYCINKENGDVLRKISAPAYWPMGLAWDGKALWNADVKTGNIYQIDPKDGTILKTIPAPGSSPRGLPWDGEYLWCTDNGSNNVIQFSLGDATTIKSFDAPATDPRGLCFDGKYFWNIDRKKDELYMIDGKTGTVLLITDAPGPFTRGLCYDGNFLWAVDYQNDKLYKLKTYDDKKYIRTNARKAIITQTHQVKNFGPGKILTLDVHLAIPKDRPSQEIVEIKYSPKPTDIIADRWHQKTAHFHYEEIGSGETINSVMTTKATIYETRYFLFPDKIGTLNDIPEKIQDNYLENNAKYQIDHPVIQKAVEKAVGNTKNCYWIARHIFDYLIDNMYYELVGGWNTAPAVLERGNGSCSEYTFVYIAMCRAAGLPARYVGSAVVRGDDACVDDVFHRWAEVYLPNYGWVPVDPSGGDQKYPRDQANHFGHLSNRFLITTESGGGSKTMSWTYNSNEFLTTEPQTKVYVETIAEWEPEE